MKCGRNMKYSNKDGTIERSIVGRIMQLDNSEMVKEIYPELAGKDYYICFACEVENMGLKPEDGVPTTLTTEE